MNTRKPRGIQNNNPLNIKREGQFMVGEIKSDKDYPYCLFDKMRYGWYAAFKYLFWSYQNGNTTYRQLVRDMYPADDGYKPNAILSKMREISTADYDKTLPSPDGNATSWLILGLEICYGLHGTGDFEHFEDMVTGWAMAWDYLYGY